MSQRRFLRVALLAVIATAGLAGGCVERRYLIQSDPPGAIVYENGKPVGATPLTRPFHYYGTYRFTLVKDGYQTLVVDECIKQPWYEYFPFDFFAENVWPLPIRDVHLLPLPNQPYQLAPPQIVPAEVLRDRANQLREQGHQIGGGPPT